MSDLNKLLQIFQKNKIEVENIDLQTDLGAVGLLSMVAGIGDFAAARENSQELAL